MLPRDTSKAADEFAAITAEDKASQVYKKLRTLRVIKRYNGRRVRKA